MRLPPVLPAVTEFFWEGHTLDCSLDEGVRAFVPVRPLFAAGGLKWVPAKRSWSDSTGRVVAQHRETELHAVLLVDEDWLGDVLAKNGWGLVLGLLGERRLMLNKLTPGVVGGWTEMNALARIRNKRTQVGRMRRERKS